jgi:hypothetical protein
MAAPGWFPDARDPRVLRWYDGNAWTAHTTPRTDLAPISDPVSGTTAVVPDWRAPAGWTPPTPDGSGQHRTDADPFSPLPTLGNQQVQAHGRQHSGGRARWPLWLTGAAAIVIAAVLLGLTHPWATTSSEPAAANPSTANGVRDQPTVGQCHHYGYQQMQAPTDSSAPVSCDDPTHTAYTIAVIPLPTGVTLPFENNHNATNVVGDACQQATDHVTGIGNGVLFSRLLGAFFEPTAAQRAAGQAWVRCDVVVPATDNKHLVPLPKITPGMLSNGPDEELAYCIDVAGPAVTWPNPVACGGAASIRVVVTSKPVNVATWPGEAAATTAANAACEKDATAFTDLPLQGVHTPKSYWRPYALCVVTPDRYDHWVKEGKPLKGTQIA